MLEHVTFDSSHVELYRSPNSTANKVHEDMEHTPRIENCITAFILPKAPTTCRFVGKKRLAFIELHALFEVQFILGGGTGKTTTTSLGYRKTSA